MRCLFLLVLTALVGCDRDGDGITNSSDNCVGNYNPNQSDEDYDGIGDACDTEDNFESDTDTDADTDSDSDTDADTDTDDTGAIELVWFLDADGDGYGDANYRILYDTQPPGYVADSTDCDDSNASVNPGATEVCNEIDDNCDGEIDEDVTSEFYADEDGDNFGDAINTVEACVVPDGYTTDATDCNDADPRAYPGNPEVCDGLDNDCDGGVDNGATDATIWYEDVDGDGYGIGVTTTACDQPPGYAAANGDCDDADSAFHPGATESDCADPNDYNCDGSVMYEDADADGWAACEDCDDSNASVNSDAIEVCDGLDNDCNGSVDGSDATDIGTWYADTDDDGYGDLAYPFVSCEAPVGYVSDATDCDDADASAYPGADEYCDGADNNCDGMTDENSALDVSVWYEDMDSDGYGNDAVTVIGCYQPTGFVEYGGDCADTDDDFYPGAAEACDDPNDYNCDGSTGYADNDSDGWAACEECNDSDPGSYPGADEYCDGADNDCDGVIDDGAVDATTWYADTDDDGYGDLAYPFVSCEAPVDYVSDATDCDDSDPSTWLGATEYCDGFDNDCDGTVDEVDAFDATTWYADADTDGYGNDAVTVVQCYEPSGYVADSTDCDDSDSTAFPGATEYCDGADNNCDGVVDDGVTVVTWYADTDSDGYGDSAMSLESCSIVSGYVTVDSDCDDSNASINPGATEVCDGLDNDCDGVADDSCVYYDADGDGYSTVLDCDDNNAAVNPDAIEVCDDGLDNDCLDGDLDCDDVDWDGDGYSFNAGDCDDEDASVYPGAGESCVNGVDDDCDGSVDYLDSDCSAFVDDDGDGYAGADCDDADAAIYPGATEIPYNGIDEDCDGSDLIDVDDDGYDYNTDCDETNPDIHPGAEEVCGDGLDNDCDGSDAVCSPVDGDGDGYLEADGDCDDADASTYPGASEICYDAADNDCDGVADDGCPAWDMDGDGHSTISDCDDTDASVNPDMTEVANSVDDDCDGVVDEGTDVYDDDGDGYSDADGDCDDSDPTVNPGEAELCDGIDNDCDGSVDEAAALDTYAWYEDADADGFGNPEASAISCYEPSGYVADATDCDDTSAAAFPGGVEVCADGLDNDCNGDTDYNDVACAGSVDSDGDGYAASIDCDDTDATINLGAADICGNGVDEDCDGADDICPPVEPTDTGDTAAPEDTGLPTETDADGDGVTVEDGDCDDNNVLTSPMSTEACSDGADNDCDGVIDETTCLGTIACVLETDGTLAVTINGNIAGGLMMPLSLDNSSGTDDLVGVTGWTTGGESTTTYLGDSVDHVLDVYPSQPFTPFADDGITSQWFDLMQWEGSGGCQVVVDPAGTGYRVEFTE